MLSALIFNEPIFLRTNRCLDIKLIAIVSKLHKEITVYLQGIWGLYKSSCDEVLTGALLYTTFVHTGGENWYRTLL